MRARLTASGSPKVVSRKIMPAKWWYDSSKTSSLIVALVDRLNNYYFVIEKAHAPQFFSIASVTLDRSLRMDSARFDQGVFYVFIKETSLFFLEY